MVDRPNKKETTHTFAATKPETQEWMPTMGTKNKGDGVQHKNGSHKATAKNRRRRRQHKKRCHKSTARNQTRRWQHKNGCNKITAKTKQEGDNYTGMRIKKSLEKTRGDNNTRMGDNNGYQRQRRRHHKNGCQQQMPQNSKTEKKKERRQLPQEWVLTIATKNKEKWNKVSTKRNERKKAQRAEGICGAARKNEGGACVYARHNDACSQRSYAQISFALSARKRRSAQLL